MRATLVERTGDRATVRLTPCRIARWFGARETVVELAREVSVYSSGEHSQTRWRSEATGTALSHLPHSKLIEHALDFVPTVPLPKAGARLRLVVNNDKKDREASE